MGEKILHFEVEDSVHFALLGVISEYFSRSTVDIKRVKLMGDFKMELMSDSHLGLAMVIIGSRTDEVLVAKKSYEEILKRSSIIGNAEVLFHTPTDPDYKDWEYYFTCRTEPVYNLLASLTEALNLH